VQDEVRAAQRGERLGPNEAVGVGNDADEHGPSVALLAMSPASARGVYVLHTRSDER